MPLVLPAMTPAQEQGWLTLLDLSASFPTGWCLVGGQMVWLLATEHGCDPPRATEDIDVVVDVRAAPSGIRRICIWLESHGFQLEGINADGIGHRYTRTAPPDGSQVIFDVLAPDNLGERIDLTTSPPARTVSTPGARTALNQAEQIEVALSGTTGQVIRPSLLSAILVKAAATAIPTRTNPERDWSDAAFLLSLVDDPLAAADQLGAASRRRLRTITPLLDHAHPAWRPLTTAQARLGHTALQFLLNPT